MSGEPLLGQRPVPNILYHYCPAQSVEPILSGGSLWVSDSASMNDATENVWVDAVLDRLRQAGEIPMGIDLGNVLYEFSLHTGPLRRILVACFTEDGDSLGQWRSYADDGRGLAIGFRSGDWNFPTRVSLDDLFRFQGVQVALEPVVYLANNQDSIVMNALRKLHSYFIQTESDNVREALTETGINALIYLARFLKHPGFHDEREWRIACRESSIDNPTLKSNSKKRLRQGNEIVYRDFHFNGSGKNTVAEIVRGPKCVITDSEIESLVSQFKVEGCSIRTSAIPYR